MHYAKIFDDIVDSSIWQEDAETRVVWITLLVLCDANGYVRGSAGWLASKAKVAVKKCEEALKKFELPDPTSRTLDNDGKRIEVLPDGFLVLNKQQFTDRLSTDPKAVASRERVRKHRERYYALRNAKSVTPRNTISISISKKSSLKKEKRVKREEEQPTLAEVRAYCAERKNRVDPEKWHNYYCSNGWKVGKNPMKDWKAAVRTWEKNDFGVKKDKGADYHVDQVL